MFDKITSVGPPQAGISEMKSDKSDLKSLREFKSSGEQKTSLKENLKSQDFQSELKKQMTKSKDLKEEKDKSEARTNKLEQERPSGGIKKKMVKSENKNSDEEKKEIDPKMISVNMASIESVNQIPDSEENLALIEDQIGVQNIDMQLETTDKVVSAEPSAIDSSVEMETVMPELDLLAEETLQPMMATEIPVELTADATLQVQPELNEEAQVVPQTELLVEPAVEQSLQPVDESFQKKIFETLQKDLQANQPIIEKQQITDSVALNVQAVGSTSSEAEQSLGQNATNQEQQDSSQSDTLSQSDLLLDAKGSDKILHAGQSDSFKNHLSTTEVQNASQLKTTADTAVDSQVKEIVNQAQYLVTKGGGEVTVNMNGADGMGDVQLKVLLENGKISIEMNTQDKSIRKMIEESLSDLKSSLANHQMSLDHVKINNVAAMNTEQSTQFNSNGQESESNQSKTFEQLQQQLQQQSQQQSQKQDARNHVRSVLNNELNTIRSSELSLDQVRKSAASRYYGLNKGNALNAVA